MLDRRFFLAGLAAVAGRAALAEAPASSPVPPSRPMAPSPGRTASSGLRPRGPDPEDLIAAAGLGGDVTYVLADAATGERLEARGPDRPMPPASTLKAVTSLYALEHLGAGFRFPTRILRTGPLEGGTLGGDLILAGGGDPTLTTDHLGDLAAALRKAGLRRVSGRFRVWGGALPFVRAIDPGQPDWFGYNPSVSGLILNFNRVNFVWKRGGAEVAMNAEGERFVPAVHAARMRVVDRAGPLYTWEDGGVTEDWTVRAAALARDGSRWLPVRQPERYAGDVFRTLAATQGIDLPDVDVASALPAGAVTLVARQSDELPVILRDMMKYSTNVTAEAVGMAASLRRGVTSHAGSGPEMERWAKGRAGLGTCRFVDHSGLGPASRISADEMVRALLGLDPRARLRGLMKEVPANEKGEAPMPGLKVEAKTGTLNFVSALVGYMTAPGGREMVFAIFSGDPARRDAIPEADREQPPGAAAWTRRARRLQRQLVTRWAVVHGG
ncbi:MAG: D-alanyl-D-alanine carboxypeptidase/D-alanyl-D-alanine-endopeptidase [Rhodobacteraceae bacterium]|nr:D-alanyl-D-alanine carboxypeptidase/D-alanyl-D-alanine-endopeptidase [Paracoccaceae bacterium]